VLVSATVLVLYLLNLGPTDPVPQKQNQTHPEQKTEEQGSYKLREKLVAVTRIERVTRGLVGRFAIIAVQ